MRFMTAGGELLASAFPSSCLNKIIKVVYKRTYIRTLSGELSYLPTDNILFLFEQPEAKIFNRIRGSFRCYLRQTLG